jgi:hypothetical protein
MTNLAGWTWGLAAVAAGVGGALAFAPAATRAWLQRFPRHRTTGWVLTAVALAWSARLLWLTPLGRFDAVKPYFVVLTPLSIALVCWAMDELLAARALGILLLLVPAPILEAARLQDSPLRLVMVVVAYAMAVKGAVLVMSPYALRKGLAFALGHDRACRIWGSIAMFYAAALAALAALIYR